MKTRAVGSKARGRRLSAVVALLAVQAVSASPVSAQGGAAPSPASAAPRSASPDYTLRRELLIGGVATGLTVATHLVSADLRPVPAQGLDPSSIGWSVDRRSLGALHVGADVTSNRTRDLAAAYPFLLVWLTSPGERWTAAGRRAVVYSEAFWIAHGVTYLGKRTIGRARPFAYADSAARASSPTFDTRVSSAFEAMPSGHSAGAFVGAGLAIAEYLLSHPEARGLQRFGVAAVGGALGGATAALRVQAGKHFPSDVLVGAGIGLGTGIALPLLHRGERPWPTRRAWLESAAGLVTGAIAGSALASVAY